MPRNGIETIPSKSSSSHQLCIPNLVLNLLMTFINKLNIPQKIEGQVVKRAFRLVTSIVGESEARLELSTICHHKQQL